MGSLDCLYFNKEEWYKIGVQCEEGWGYSIQRFVLMCKIEVYAGFTLPREEIGVLSRLHYRCGSMWPTFRRFRNWNYLNYFVLLAKINKKTVGWGLLEIKEPAWMKLYNYGADDPQAYIMLYVQRKYRRRGISTKICARAHLISAEYNTRLIGYTGLANQIIEKSA